MSSSTDDVPFYLMPVAAILGMYVMAGCVRLLYLIYAYVTKRESISYHPPPKSTWLILISTVVVAALAYGKVVASVNNAMEASSHALFDPYEILEIDTSSNSTIIKQAYRNLSKVHHPDKGGSTHLFQNIHLAYKALTDETAMLNYQQYGHPDGPPSSTSLAFALPSWLLHPEGNVALILLLLYLGMFVFVITVAVRFATNSEKAQAQQAQANSVAGADASYLAAQLSPTSTHLDVLYAIATTPENINVSLQVLEKAEQLKQERLAQGTKEKKKDTAFDSLIDGAWAQDDDDDENAAKAQELEEEKKKERKDLQKAQGAVLLEGFDEGVIGQAWVERTLAAEGEWPPKNLGLLEGKTFAYKGKKVTALEHPAIRRNLCMTTGRLNSIILNSHAELLEAGSKGLVDQTYFKTTMEYRQRAGLLLEAALRVAVALRSYRLAKTIVEAVTMFKVGTMSATDAKNIEWFQGVMKRQYGCVPVLKITNLVVETDDEDEIATGDTCTAKMDIERLHAENFTKQKIALCKKQGIPPQVALQTYREGWWVMVRAEKLDGGKVPPPPDDPKNQMKKLLKDVDLEKYASEEQENRLLTAWPMMVQNVAQKSGKIKIQFKAPAVAGKYRFHISIKSQEFLGADVELVQESTIIDVADVKRVEDEEVEDEQKKDK